MADQYNNPDKSNTDTGFVADLDYEVCTPMNAILGDLELILREPINDRVRSMVTDIQEAANGLMTVINDVIDYDLLKNGVVELSEEEYLIANLCGEIEEQAARTVKDKKLRLSTEVSKDIGVRYWGDHNKILKIVAKLISNSLSLTPEGSIHLSIACEPEAEGYDTLIFALEDMSDEGVCNELISISEKFDAGETGSLAKTSTRRIYLAKMYAGLMGGSLNLSTRGDGLIYEFKVRQMRVGISTVADTEDDEEDIKLSADINFWISNARVLVVDDNHINSRIADYILKSFGVDADIIDTGPGAIELIKRIDYDIVFMDNVMPNTSGAEITATIRQMGTGQRKDYYKRIPIVGWTASKDKYTRDAMIKAGMDECLDKPLDVKKIEGVLKRWLPSEKFRDIKDIRDNFGEIDALERLGIKARSAFKNFSDKEEEYRSVLLAFCRSSETKRKLIKRYLKQKDYINYILTLHGLIGVADIVGAKWLSDKARLLEDAAKDERRETIESDTAAFLDYMEKLVSAVEKIIGQDDINRISTGQVDRSDLGQLVNELIECIETYQYDQAEEIFYELAQNVYDNEEVMEHIHIAEMYMMDYDYKKVTAELQQIRTKM
ncbi:MAG: response regulator [Lachnospiraceae bacterium]|nr:response regulator [Lachnospiraceae bacterium]